MAERDTDKKLWFMHDARTIKVTIMAQLSEFGFSDKCLIGRGREWPPSNSKRGAKLRGLDCKTRWCTRQRHDPTKHFGNSNFVNQG